MALRIHWPDNVEGTFSVYFVLVFVEFVFYPECVVWVTAIISVTLGVMWHEGAIISQNLCRLHQS